jgi:hypothetical protein
MKGLQTVVNSRAILSERSHMLYRDADRVQLSRCLCLFSQQALAPCLDLRPIPFQLC